MPQDLQIPAFKITVNKKPLPDAAASDIIAVTVYEDVGAPGMFTLRLYNWDMDKLQVKWVDEANFAEGSPVEIQMGYQDSELKSMIVGEITGLEPAFNSDEPFSLTVRGYDCRHRLLRGRKTRSFAGMTDSGIAAKIAQEADLTSQVVDSQVKLDYVLQHNQTDMEFLQERARRIGYEVMVQGKELHFRPQQIAQPEVLTLSLEEDIVEFYPRSSTLAQVGQVTVRSWDPKTKEALIAQAQAGKETSTMGGSNSGPQASDQAFGASVSSSVNWPMFSQAEADQSALGWFNAMALAYVGGEGLCQGRTELRAGAVVKIEGLGKRFSGSYYVVSTRHNISPGADAVGAGSSGMGCYRTAFTVRRNAS